MILDFATLSILVVPVAVAVVLATLIASLYSIGPTQIGLVRKRFGASLPGDNPLAFRGEAGYQAGMLMPGLRFKSFTLDDDGQARNFYLWDDEEKARAFFTEEVVDMVTGIYGVAPKIEYLDVLEFVDNSGT